MYPYLTDEHNALREQVRRFIDQEIMPIAADIDRDNEFPLEAYRKMGELGYIGPSCSPEYGGSGADLLSTAIIKEETARGAPGLAMSLNVCSLNFVHTVETLGSEAQKQNYLPGVVSGEKITSWMLTEPDAGSDSLALATTARPDGDHYIVNGVKTFITNGTLADYFICIARLPGSERGRGGMQLILEKGMEGLSVGPKFDKMGMRCSPTCEVFMEDVKVPKDNLLGTEGEGFREMFDTLNPERSMGASTNIGIMQACLEICSRYVKERHQFGRPIGDFQLVQEMIAQMAMNLELSRHGQALRLAQRGQGLVGRRADPWRLRLRQGVPRRALLPGRQAGRTGRRHLPDPDPAHRPGHIEAGNLIVAENRIEPGRKLERTDYYLMLGIGLLAFLIRIIYLVSYSGSPYWDALVMDPKNHWELAKAVAAGHGMGPYAYFRAPLYIWTLAGFVSLFGESLWPVRILQALSGSLTAVMTVRLSRYRLSRPASGMAGAGMAIFWIPVYFDGELLITSLATLLGVSALVAVISADSELRRGGSRPELRFLAAGIVCGLSAIARPNMLVFAAAAPAIVVLRALLLSGRRGQGISIWEAVRAPVASAVLFGAGVLACVAPVTIRNFTATDDFVLISSQGGINFWLGNHEGADGRTVVVPHQRRDIPLSFIRSRRDHPWLNEDVWLSSAYGAEQAMRKRVRESEISRYWYATAFEWIKDKPGDAAFLALKKSLYLLQAVEVSNNRDLHHHRDSLPILRLLSPLHFGVIAPLIMAGAVVALFKFRQWFWPLVFFLTYALTVIAFFITTRYRVPLLPVGMAFAALFVETLVQKHRSGDDLSRAGRLLSLTPLLGLLALFAVASNLDRPRWNDRPVRSAMHYNLGIALAGRGDLSGSEAEFMEALRIKDFYPEAHFWLGKIMIASGEPDRAVAEFEQSVKQAPAYAPAHFELYLLYSRLSRHQGDDFHKRARSHKMIAHQLEPDTYPE
jgi:alkylation response protein AidB-like acyl-CoA dehydrogenase/4-amino-4-deoxy-L-arabinose transferase-like glycosyltransferase